MSGLTEATPLTSLRSAMGKQVVSRATAETLGQIRGAVIDVASHSVASWQVDRGRKATLIDHAHVTGLGEAALVIDHEDNLRMATTPEEVSTVKGHTVILGALVLSTSGDKLGEVVDIDVDPVTAELKAVRLGETSIDAASIRGFGSYALVVGIR